MHWPVRAGPTGISLDQIRSLLASASGHVEFYTPARGNHAGCRGKMITALTILHLPLLVSITSGSVKATITEKTLDYMVLT